MPALPLVPGVLRLQLKHTLGSDVDVLDRIYLQYTGTAPTSSGLNTMASSVETAWASDLKSYFTTNGSLTEVVIEDLSSASGGVGTWSGSTAGTRTGGVLAAGSAVLLNFSIARRYRGGKPRIYLPYLVSADTASPQTWNGTTLAALLTAWNTFVTAVIAAAPSGTTITNQANVSYYSGFTNFTGPTGRMRARSTVRATALIDAVTATSTNAKVASQRRRNGQKR